MQRMPPRPISLSMGKIVFVHGINERESSDIFELFKPHCLRHGIDYVELEYGWIGPISAYFGNSIRARSLSIVVDPTDVIICHSNGAAIAYRASRDYGLECKGHIWINPAVKNTLVPYDTGKCYVLYNPSDKATWLARAASWIPGVVWGGMGATGYIGNSEIMENINERDFGNLPVADDFLDHSAVKHYSEWREFIIKDLALDLL